MTTGDGGMFVSMDSDFAKKVSKARAFGVDRSYGDRSIPGMYDVPTLGLNYRMSDINASIGREQLKRIHNILNMRKKNFHTLRDILSDIPGIHILDAVSDDQISSYYCLSIVLDTVYADHRTDIIHRLNSAGIGTSIYYPQPVPRMAYYQQKYGYNPQDFPHAEKISDRSIALPVGPHLNAEDLKYIGSTVQKVFGDFNE
jgi:dTDP-4-amino-4,6-dideoxygalactose transaminase